MEILNLSQYVPRNFPEVEAIRSQGCPYTAPKRERFHFTKAFFCNKWGDSFKCFCPPKFEKKSWNVKGSSEIRGVSREVQSLNYFSALPLRPEGIYPGVKEIPTMGQQYGLVQKNLCPKGPLGFSATCPNMKPFLSVDDTICGSCIPQQKPSPQQEPKCDEFPGYDLSPNLPFTVTFTKPPLHKKLKIRTGVEQCLQPSRFRDINTVYRENFTNFMTSKSRKQISLYRSPLAIDNRRPRPQIPVDLNRKMVIGVNNGPITFSAKAVGMKSCGKKKPPCRPQKPDYELFLSGPICIPVDKLPEYPGDPTKLMQIGG